MSNIQKMLKQAQKMQKEMEKTQNQLADTQFTFSSNGVTAVAKGDFTIVSLTLNPELLESPDKDMLEDLVIVAVNGALVKAREEMETRLSGITGGMNLPGIM